MDQFRYQIARFMGEQDSDEQVSPFAECGKFTKSLLMKECTKDCERFYSIYIPTSLCDSNNKLKWQNPDNSENIDVVEIFPIVFALHCYGCSGDYMGRIWDDVAEEYNFVLVKPEGIKRSFNAKVCCGYALDHKLDDVGFFRNIIANLTSQFSFVSDDFTYAVGFSNGGYMASYAAHLFRAIAPIAGYQYDEDLTAITSNVPTGLFMHHNKDDEKVKISGCCSNSTMPVCCCGISNQPQTPQQCTSVTQAYDRWADQVNHCSLPSENESPVISYSNEAQGVVCRTGQGCQANTTLCVYERGGHSDSILTNEIASFFARDACEVYGNSHWLDLTRECSCTKPKNIGESNMGGGSYCLSSVGRSSELSTNNSPSARAPLFIIVVILLGFGYLFRYNYKLRLMYQRSKYVGWKKLSMKEEDDEVEVELSSIQ